MDPADAEPSVTQLGEAIRTHGEFLGILSEKHQAMEAQMSDMFDDMQRLTTHLIPPVSPVQPAPPVLSSLSSVAVPSRESDAPDPKRNSGDTNKCRGFTVRVTHVPLSHVPSSMLSLW